MALKPDETRAYAKQWKAWWSTLNPEWRKRPDGELVITVGDDWTCMLHVGSNGFVNILAGLIAYHDVSAEAEWNDAATDVAWVLQQLLSTANSHG